ncbi:XRE family transcriptional regulator [[Bacillus] enclensis]|jgi:DNA-binding XRE family transcriptional regulator|uniref:DNA-binding transcriptional regulator, XRE-family HTH domain n=2 Tax=Rossellomorea TaxID=2837508 RepID=A0A0V8HHZ2_9BACI|nr:helix-turn-helix domain-containing protein [[Bacillus] enclensis]KSU62077.1 XRE family transcriptional regulator [[Bacillus] enclensis]QTC41974.1 helix-turn-helix domain-containing protein [Bacillus sp. V3]QWC24041.1 helix-turn-helix domain-containing protein [Bacillus haikouensis]SCB98872.1 DNA-binding transcriptional regulator, XRE-family HTH domain [[Bacillus] enclensis]
MKKEEVITIISDKLRLIRTEAGYTQDKMANVIGISKKTLVQIEKRRVDASWTAVIAVCALFRDSETLVSSLGGEPLEVIETLAREGVDFRKEKTLGGKVWWKEIKKSDEYVLQQNLFSKHYRILDRDHYRIYSSFNEEESENRFNEIQGEED